MWNNYFIIYTDGEVASSAWHFEPHDKGWGVPAAESLSLSQGDSKLSSSVS